MNLAYPIRFEPIYRDYVWGGQKIAAAYGREGGSQRIAESWEISDRPDGMSVVANGPYQGASLRELVQTMGENLLGKGKTAPVFPLLVKILDAKESLSVQVHPNDQTASLVQGEPKTEMWYVLDSSLDAGVFAGVSENFSSDDLQKGRLVEKLAFCKVLPHEAIYIPGGCIHAIGAGCFMLEVQQNSDTTYRIYDWDRRGADGHPRELHLDKALQVLNPHLRGIKQEAKKISEQSDFTLWSVLACPYFNVKRLNLSGAYSLASQNTSFQILFCLSGEGTIAVDGTKEFFKAGMTYLIPASFSFAAIQGHGQIIFISME